MPGCSVVIHADWALVHPRSLLCSVQHSLCSRATVAQSIFIFLCHFIQYFRTHVGAWISANLQNLERVMAQSWSMVGSPGQKMECILKQTIRERPFTYSNCSSSSELKKGHYIIRRGLVPLVTRQLFLPNFFIKAAHAIYACIFVQLQLKLTKTAMH